MGRVYSSTVVALTKVPGLQNFVNAWVLCLDACSGDPVHVPLECRVQVSWCNISFLRCDLGISSQEMVEGA